jgi:cyclophilin family peptidyl-prolyl cis-trans isomerase
VLGQLAKDFPQDVRVVYRHFPLPGHDKSLLATQAAEAAGLQGKFWEMHDAIFAGQGSWTGMTLDQFETWLKDQAKTLGLDEAKFATDLKSDALVQKATQATENGNKLGIPGTPLILINSEVYQGPRDYENLASIVSLYKLQERQFKSCPPMTIDPKKQYIATLKTDVGDIVIQLFADKAPMAVNSFIFLANQGWYNNNLWYRVIPGSFAQSGDPSGSGNGDPGYAYSNEIAADSKFDKPGVFGMFNSGTSMNGSRFFIIYTPAPELDGQYTVFGQVIAGMDVLAKLTPRNPSDPNAGNPLPAGSKIISVTITEK